MSAPRPRATLSFDMDDLWTYLKTRGDERWASYPTYLPVIVPRTLALLDECGVRITFFLVGRDASVTSHAALFRTLADRGHEIGNHSFEHDCWLHRYRPSDLHSDISRAEAAIERATGRRPVGFRGPGFSWSPDLLEVLAARGYRYDASTLPTIVGPLARQYFLRTARLTPEQRQERQALFGSFDDAIRPLKPYRWGLKDEATLLEVPVTTMPGTRLPFHLSYLIYLRSYSWHLMAAYLEAALLACRAGGVEPSFLLHPLDLLSAEEAPGLEFFPGMGLSAEEKSRVFRHAIARIQRHFDVVTLETFVADLAKNSALAVRRPSRSFGDTPARDPNPDRGGHGLDSQAFRLEHPESLSHRDTEVYRET